MNLELLNTIFTPILNAGPLFLIFFIFTITGLVFRLSLIRAIRNGLMITVGFGGVYIIVDYFVAKIAPAASALSQRFGGVFSITDVGWAPMASFAWGSPWAYLFLVILLAVNLLMIFTKMTDTLNLNIWDFWEPIFASLIIYALTKNIILSTIACAVFGWFNLILADFTAQRGFTAELGFSGLAFYQGGNVFWAVFGHYLAKLFDKLGWKETKFTPDYIKEKFGVFGEPAVLGAVIGLLMGIGAGFFWIDIVMLMISLATSLVLLPMMAGIVMQALVPVTEAASEFMKKSVRGRELYIGVDPAIGVGNTTNLAVGILMIPVMLILAFVIPGVNSIPLADLPGMIFIWIFLIVPNKFDLLRTFVSAIIVGVIGTILGIFTHPWSTLVAKLAGFEIPAGTAGVTSANNIFDVQMFAAGVLGEGYEKIGYIGVVAILILAVVVSIVFRLRYLKNKRLEIAA